MKNFLSLSNRMYLSLSAIVLFYALLAGIFLYLIGNSSYKLNKMEEERDENVVPLQSIRLITTGVQSDLERWLLFRDTEYNFNYALTWPKAYNQYKAQLLNSSSNWSNKSQIEMLNLMLDQIRALEQSFKEIEQQLPDVQAFKDSIRYNRALAVLVQRAIPASKDILRLCDELQSERSKELSAAVSEARNSIGFFNNLGLISIFLFALFILAIGYYLIKILIRPIYDIRSYLSSMALGDLPDTPLPETPDELGNISRSINTLVNGLRRSVDFATQIGQGNFNAQFDYVEGDALGQALTTMRDRLQVLNELEARRNWAISGLARFGDILRRSQDLKVLGEEVISNLVRYIKANLGAIFILNDENPADPRLEMLSSYAYNKRKFLERSFRIGEGLIGQAALELETIHITQIPDNYVILQSGLGEAPPSSLLIVPLVSNDALFGVIELASFNRIRDDEIDFVKKLGENIASVINNARSNERTLHLLEQSQRMSRELQEQSLKLQEGSEQMLRAQQELKRTNEALELQMRKLNQTAMELSRSEKRFYTLLENASEIITIFEKDGMVRYQSPSVERIVGYKPDELTNFFRYVEAEDQQKVREFFFSLLKGQQSDDRIEYRYRRKDGTVIYLESFGRNLLNDPSISGIIMNTRDITERIRADQNMRQRLKFESFSQNSPDLIIRFDLNGRYLYINPVIERYSDRRPDYFIKNSIYSVGLSAQEIQNWEKLIKETAQIGEKKSTEMIFPSVLGDRNMRVDVIPEFNVDNVVETVIVVAHDITEAKQAEAKIREQSLNLQRSQEILEGQKKALEEINQDMKESLLYAKRIQDTILPADRVIEMHFPEFFKIFAAKDIVSGDFYWFYPQGRHLYLAAVDCTGHGVPGAFMSLIGYTLLNQILSEHPDLHPHEILEDLHLRVQQALKQSEQGPGNKDGMDLALCMIDKEKRIVEFSGARRPILWWHQYEMVEIKGDKYGIGGFELDSGERKFVTHTLKFEVGDAIYLFSDGYTDQFGGPENKKFTLRRFKEILERNHHRTMDEQRKLLEKAFEEWKNKSTQVDDVVVIGIRF